MDTRPTFADISTDVILYILHEHHWCLVSRFIRCALRLPADFDTVAFLDACHAAATASDTSAVPASRVNVMQYFDESLFVRNMWGRFADGRVHHVYANFSMGSERNTDLLVLHSWRALENIESEQLFQLFIEPWLRVMCR